MNNLCVGAARVLEIYFLILWSLVVSHLVSFFRPSICLLHLLRRHQRRARAGYQADQCKQETHWLEYEQTAKRGKYDQTRTRRNSRLQKVFGIFFECLILLVEFQERVDSLLMCEQAACPSAASPSHSGFESIERRAHKMSNLQAVRF